MYGNVRVCRGIQGLNIMAKQRQGKMEDEIELGLRTELYRK